MNSCATVVAKTLRETGIRTIFGLPGGEVVDLIEACRQEEISFILTRHETAAAFMAEVTGQITRRPGVCVSTLGPGAINLLLGVANAYLERSPLLAISGQMSNEASPYCTHQRVDIPAIFQPVTKWNTILDAKNTRDKVKKAINIATQHRMGPVHLTLPNNVAKSEDKDFKQRKMPTDKDALSFDSKLLKQAIAELQQASYPLAVIGINIDPLQNAEMINKFIEKTQIPVMATPKAKGVISESNPLYLATAAGMAGDRVIMEFLEKVDLLVGIGFDPVESDKIWHKEKKLLSIDTASTADRAYAPWLELVGNVDSTLAIILDSYKPSHMWERKDFQTFKDRMVAELKPRISVSLRGLSPYHVALRLRQLLPPSTILTTDVGAHKLLFGQIWTTYEPMTFFMSNGLSSMGYGLPSAMAAKLQFPNRDVVSICGDGGFFMMLQDLETVVRLELPLIVIVFCDQILGLIDVVQKRRGYPSYGIDFGNTNLAEIANGFGAHGVRVNSLKDLDKTVSQGLKEKVPVVIEVSIDPEEYAKQM
jgi:acetolactate synthase-1/2/3 large subunit